jgi:hypothetical protein
MERTLKFEELPGIPQIWIDFLRSEVRLLTLPSGIEDLVTQAGAVRGSRTGNDDLLQSLADQAPQSSRVLENIQRLSRPDTVAVITEICACLLGGPTVHILKCLTAIKLCEELAKHGIDAIPVGWISPDPPPDYSSRSVTLIDAGGEIRMPAPG